MGCGSDQAGRQGGTGGAPPLSRIERLPGAVDDLIAIWAYVAERDVDAADRLIDRIGDRLRMLSGSPMIGTPRPELAGDLRSFVVGRYVLFYRPVGEGVVLVRVLHGARDLRAALDER